MRKLFLPTIIVKWTSMISKLTFILLLTTYPERNFYKIALTNQLENRGHLEWWVEKKKCLFSWIMIIWWIMDPILFVSIPCQNNFLDNRSHWLSPVPRCGHIDKVPIHVWGLSYNGLASTHWHFTKYQSPIRLWPFSWENSTLNDKKLTALLHTWVNIFQDMRSVFQSNTDFFLLSKSTSNQSSIWSNEYYKLNGCDFKA